MNETSDGKVIVEGDERLLRFERRYEFPITDVWHAITDKERSGRWLFSTEFEPRSGGIMRTDLGELGVVEGRVIVWEAPHRLEYEWTEPASPESEASETWHVRFELREDGDATVVVFDHVLPEPARPEFAAGWHWYLDRLGALLSGNPPASVLTDDAFDRLLQRYQGGADD